MIEPEIAFATLAEDMALAEDYLKFCTQWVLDHCSEDLDFFEATFEKGLKDRLRNVIAEPFQVLPYTEAIELLLQPEHQAAGKFVEKVFWGCDLASEHERYITERVFKKPVILINYPKDIKSFYMKLNPDGKVRHWGDGHTALCLALPPLAAPPPLARHPAPSHLATPHSSPSPFPLRPWLPWTC
jgi:asparaginyl-tRNA synthetase